MKTIFSNLLLFIPCLFFAQSNDIESLRVELKTLEGAAFVEKAILLSDEYFKQEKYQGAAGAAVHAYKKAEKIADKEGMAKALNREGKALLRQKRKGKNKAKIALKFTDSNKLLEETGNTNDELRLSNLRHLKRMAQQLNRTKDFNELEKQIREIQASSKNNLTQDSLQSLGELLGYVDEKKLNPKQRRAFEKLKEVESKYQESNQQIIQEMEQAKEDMEKMSEEQIKTELLYAQYKMRIDSLETKSMIDSLQIVQQNMELKTQTMELETQDALLAKQKARRWFYIAIIAIVLILAGGLFSRYKAQKKHSNVLEEKNEVIEKEKERSESLLLNILPEKIAKELKINGKAKARYHSNVSVFFADFVKFSKISEQLSPERLVEELDYCFKNFDKIIEKYQLEKNQNHWRFLHVRRRFNDRTTRSCPKGNQSSDRNPVFPSIAKKRKAK